MITEDNVSFVTVASAITDTALSLSLPQTSSLEFVFKFRLKAVSGTVAFYTENISINYINCFNAIIT